MTLELDRVTKTVGGEQHLYEVSMSLNKGSLNVLLGPTLAGKTSLMRLMAGLEKPSSGRILVNGEDVTSVPVRKRNVAMVYQEFVNYPTLTVYENIASPLRVAGASRAEIDRKVREVAESVHLTPMLKRLPLELSGGQQQRVALARALVKGANLVLLDEPLANLDYKLREEMRADFARIFEASDAIFVYATTEPVEALLLGGNTATVNEGRVTQFGPAPEVYHRPRDLISARTFSDPPLNTLAVEKQGDSLSSDDGSFRIEATTAMKSLADGHYTLGFRPHHLHLAKPAGDSVGLSVRVDVSEITGSESFVHVSFGGVKWVAGAHGVHNVEVGSEIGMWVEPTRMFVFDADDQLVVAPSIATSG